MDPDGPHLSPPPRLTRRHALPLAPLSLAAGAALLCFLRRATSSLHLLHFCGASSPSPLPLPFITAAMALPGGVKQMIITFGAISLLKKVDQTDARVVAICRMIFVVYMAISLSVQLYIRSRILAKKEGGTVTVPPKPASPFAALSEPAPDADATPAPAAKEGDASAEEEVDATIDATTGGRREPRGAGAPAELQVMTTEEYDLSVLATVRRGLLFNALLLSLFHLKMGSLNPLVITSATGLVRLVDEPLFQLHVLGRPAVDALQRPFKPEVNPLVAMLTGTPPDGDDADANADAASPANATETVATAPVMAAGEKGGAKGAASSKTTARRRKVATGTGATRRVPAAAAGRKDE